MSVWNSSNTLFWNTLIRVNVGNGFYRKAIELFHQMRELGMFGDCFTFPLVIRACANLGSYNVCRMLHAHALEMGYGNHLHSANELMIMYTKHGNRKSAQKVLGKMPVRNHVSWNILLSSCSMNCDCDGAIDVFSKMEADGLRPNVVSWVSLLSCHSRANKSHQTLELFSLMRRKGVNPNAETLAVVVSACTEVGESGQSYHSCVVKLGFETSVIVANALICFHGKCGDLKAAVKLFHRTPNKTIVSWNALITAYVYCGLCDEAFGIFSQLKGSRILPNVVTWSAMINGYASSGRFSESLDVFRQMQLCEPVSMATVLSVCAELSAHKLGKEVHARAIRVHLGETVLLGNGLVNMYLKCGSLREGKLVFFSMEVKDIFSWNSMITGYARNGKYRDAVKVFDEMTSKGVKPDGITFVGILTACRNGGFHREGRRFYELMVREYQIEPQMEHYACLADLLGRCGMLQEAIEVIKSMPMDPNECVLGSLLSSYISADSKGER